MAKAVPLKRGCPNLDLLPTHDRHKAFSGKENMKKRKNLTKFSGTNLRSFL